MSVEARQLTFAYPRRPAVLEDVAFQLEPGSLNLIVGASGAGKSTLLQLLAGILKPVQGEIVHRPFADGVRNAPLSTMVFQYPERHFFHVTVHDELAFGLRRLGLDAGEVASRIDDVLALLGIDGGPIVHQSPFRLSGGEARLVAVAVGLVMRPQTLLLDEPAAGLDAGMRHRLFEAVDRWRQQHGSTVVIVSHDMSGIAHRAHRVMALDEGRVVFDGAPTSFFYRETLLQQLGLVAPPLYAVASRLKAWGLSISDRTDVESVVNSVMQAVHR